MQVRRPAPHPAAAAARVAVAAVAAFLAPTAAVGAVLLDFEGIPDDQLVGSYYAGGGGGPSKNYGITFGTSAKGAIDTDAGGSFPIAKEPSPDTVSFMAFPDPQAFLTVAGGFIGLSFQYACQFDMSATVYDGPDRTGTALGTTSLPATGGCGDCGDPNGVLGIWFNVTVAFSGVAQSVGFSTSDGSIFLDDMLVRLASETNAPTTPPTKAPATTPPTKSPTNAPTKRPTKAPTVRPTRFPTRSPVLTSTCPRKGMKGNRKCGMMVMMMK
jgi:hypothetical protein